MVEPAASSIYNALELRAERPAPAGSRSAAAYTWGQAIDDSRRSSPATATTTRRRTAAARTECGSSDFDVRHRLVAAAIWQVPRAATARGRGLAGERALHGADRPAVHAARQLRQQQHRQPGRPVRLRPAERGCRLGTAGAVTLRGTRVRDRAAVHVRRRRPEHPDRAGIRQPRHGHRPHRWTSGAARRLELRAEIYNLLNRTNLDLPDSFVDRPTFGQSLSADAGRLAQLAARFRF